jgi:hypothetical protein
MAMQFAECLRFAGKTRICPPDETPCAGAFAESYRVDAGSDQISSANLCNQWNEGSIIGTQTARLAIQDGHDKCY